MNDIQQHCIGIDIGGSHITVAIVDLNGKKIVKETWHRQHVDSKGSADEIIDAWCSAILHSCRDRKFKPKRLGVAMPGPFDYEKGIALMKDNDKFSSLYSLNIKAKLSQKLNIDGDNIFIMNDAAAFLNGELFAGSAKGYNRAIGLTMGTGLGSAMLNGLHVVDAGLWYSPFKDGIAEDYLSTRWFIERYKQLSGIAVNGVKDISAGYADSNPAKQVFDEFAINLALFLKLFVLIEKPDVIVIGGNIMNNEHLFMPQVNSFLYENQLYVPIMRSLLGEEAAILGASAWL